MEVEIKERVNLSNQIKVNRINQGYSRQELGELSGIAKNTIRLIEEEKYKTTRLNVIIALAKALGITLEDIIVEKMVIVCEIMI